MSEWLKAGCEQVVDGALGGVGGVVDAEDGAILTVHGWSPLSYGDLVEDGVAADDGGDVERNLVALVL